MPGRQKFTLILLSRKLIKLGLEQVRENTRTTWVLLSVMPVLMTLATAKKKPVEKPSIVPGKLSPVRIIKTSSVAKGGTLTVHFDNKKQTFKKVRILAGDRLKKDRFGQLVANGKYYHVSNPNPNHRYVKSPVTIRNLPTNGKIAYISIILEGKKEAAILKLGLVSSSVS